MKNISKLLVFVLCLTVILASFALAANTQTYTLDELYMQVSIPTELAVFTRNIDEADPNLAAFGLDKQSLEEHYTNNNIYLNPIAMDGSHELVITKTTNEDVQKLFNFSLYDDKALNEMETSLREGYSKKGYALASFTKYQRSTAKYFVLDFTQQANGTTVYSRQFYTVYNGLAINITLHSYAGELTSGLENELQSIVDSVVFTKTLPTPEDTLASAPNKTFTSYLWVWIRCAAIGGIVGLVIYLTKKAAKKKSAANSSSDNNNI